MESFLDNMKNSKKDLMAITGLEKSTSRMKKYQGWNKVLKGVQKLTSHNNS